MGPTGSGKSELAIALSEAVGGEIVSVDSAQVFRGLDIGTAKPSAEERSRAPHHLIDVVDPNAQWSAAAFAENADRAIAEIRSRGRRPILCGGTGLWLRALIHGVFEAPSIAPEIREPIRRALETLGAPALHEELRALDPEAAARLHPNDAQRIGRALEVVRQTGVPISKLQAEHGFKAERYPLIGIALRWEHARFEARLGERTRAMYARGWIAEVESLIARGVDPHGPGLSIIGYRDVVQHLEGKLSRAAAEEETRLATRRYARRQRSWFGKEPAIEWLPADTPPSAVLQRLREREAGPPTH
jgi:tRNA dimethylallyltransferase